MSSPFFIPWSPASLHQSLRSGLLDPRQRLTSIGFRQHSRRRAGLAVGAEVFDHCSTVGAGMGFGNLGFLTGFLYFFAGPGLPDITTRAFRSSQAPHRSAGAFIDPGAHLYAGYDLGGFIGFHSGTLANAMNRLLRPCQSATTYQFYPLRNQHSNHRRRPRPP